MNLQLRQRAESAVCVLAGHDWVTRYFRDRQSKEFKICRRCGRSDGDAKP